MPPILSHPCSGATCASFTNQTTKGDRTDRLQPATKNRTRQRPLRPEPRQSWIENWVRKHRSSNSSHAACGWFTGLATAATTASPWPLSAWSRRSSDATGRRFGSPASSRNASWNSLKRSRRFAMHTTLIGRDRRKRDTRKRDTWVSALSLSCARAGRVAILQRSSEAAADHRTSSRVVETYRDVQPTAESQHRSIARSQLRE